MSNVSRREFGILWKSSLCGWPREHDDWQVSFGLEFILQLYKAYNSIEKNELLIL